MASEKDWPAVTIDDAFITMHGVTPDGGDHLIPRWLGSPLLKALAREQGYEERWAIVEDQFAHDSIVRGAYLVYATDNPEEIMEQVRKNNARAVKILVPTRQEATGGE